jgi:hypothetical protein
MHAIHDFLTALPAIFWVRFGFVVLCLSALVLLVKRHREAVAGLNKFMFEPTSAVNLGLLRIVVFFTLFRLSFTNPASWFASLSPNFVNLPRGWEWLGDVYPVALHWVRPEERLFVVASAFAALGLFTRASTIVASLLAVWLLGIPNFYFKIGHDMHVPVLCSLVLACSPAGDALSLDSLIRRFRAPRRLEPNVAYTVPVRFSWLLLGTMYLFPGLWKLWESGDLWINGNKLRLELFSKWAQLPEYVPAFRADHSQRALAFFGIMTLVFEVGFFFAVFNRKTRVFAGLQASLFHLGIGLMMDIWFSMYFPLIVLIDLPQILDVPPFRWIAGPVRRSWAWLVALAKRVVPRLTRETADALVPPPPAASFVAGSVLLLAMIVAGIGPVDSWPVSIYPRFSDRGGSPPRSSYGLAFVAKLPSGEEKDLKIEFRPFEDTAGVFRVVRAAINAKKRGRQAELDEHVALIARVVRENSPPMPPGTRLFIYRFDFSVDPEDRVKDTRRRSLIAETDL